MARKILLADDSVTAQNMGRKILTDAGYEVITVNNGSAALKKILEHKPDLIVLDVYMPGYSGLEVCQRIKENRESAKIPVLLTVGKLEPFKPEEARRARADAFVVKPFEASELLAALTKLEDKIIPQPEPYKQGRFAKAVAFVDHDTDADKLVDLDQGWKARLRIPTGPAKPRDSEPDPDYAATQGKGFRDFVEPSGKKNQSKPATNESPRPLPAGIPHDITPEEIAALAAAAAQLNHVVAAPETSEEKSPVEETETHVEVAEESATEEATPVTFASSPEVSATEPEAVSSQASSEATPAEDTASMGMAEVTSPQPVASETISVETTSAPVEAVQAVTETVNLEAVPPTESIEAQPEVLPAMSVEISSAVSLLEPAQAPGAAPAETAFTAEAAAAPEITTPPAPAADDEVMAALQTLMPSPSTSGVADSATTASKNEFGSSSFAAAEASDRPGTRTHAAGPRWIAEEVGLAAHEAALSLEREMERAYAAFNAQESPRASMALEARTAATPAETQTTAAPASAEPAVVYAMASAAAAGEGVPVQLASTTIQHPEEDQHSEEIMMRSAEAASAPQPVATDTNIEHEIVGGTETMAANWKNIRDSIAGAAAKPAPSKEDFQETEVVKPEPADTPAAEKASSSPAATDPTAIASIVDSVLAELRPKIVEEIARKLADPKKS